MMVQPSKCKEQKSEICTWFKAGYYWLVWGLSIGNVSYKAHTCSVLVFLTIQETTLPVEQLRGYTIALL